MKKARFTRSYPSTDGIDLTSAFSRLLAYVLVSGGPPEQLANVRWPMHKALYELFEDVGRTGQRDLFGGELEFQPSEDGGFAVKGADRALDALASSSILDIEGELRDARLVLNAEAAIGLRRELMLLPVEQVTLYRRAGTRWAALASTAAKNRSAALRSSASGVASSRPKREGEPLAETCW